MFLSLKIKQLKYIFLVVQFNFSTILVKKFSRVVGGLGCVGKKTTLLQAEASACVSGLANVLFCALAVIFSFFFFLSLSSKLSALSFFLRLLVTYVYTILRIFLYYVVSYIHMLKSYNTLMYRC